MSWKNGWILVWDATCLDTFVLLHAALAAGDAGTVASHTERKTFQKYAFLSTSHHFVSIAIEASGVFGPEALSFLKELGRWIKAETKEQCSLQFLLQRIALSE